MMKLSLRCRHWSVLQVVAFVVCYRGNVLCGSTTETFSRPDSTEDILHTEENTPNKETKNESSTKDSDLFLDGTTTTADFQTEEDSDRNEDWSDNPLLLPVVMTTICLVLLIAIVVVVVIMRRKSWPIVSAAVEMVNNDSRERSDGILYANENQTVSQNEGNETPMYSNFKIKKSKVKSAKAYPTYKGPNNGVYSLANGDGSRPTEDPIVYCDVESREPAYQVPRSDVYSVVRDVGGPECSDSTADASNEDDNVYCNVETRETAEAANSCAANDYDEACNWKENEYKAVKADKTIPSAQKKKRGRPAHKCVPDVYTKVNKPSKRGAAFDTPGVEAKVKVIQESIYANDPTLSPIGSLTSRTLSKGGSETENPDCEMRSPPMRFKDDGSKTVVETGEQ